MRRLHTRAARPELSLCCAAAGLDSYRTGIIYYCVAHVLRDSVTGTEGRPPRHCAVTQFCPSSDMPLLRNVRIAVGICGLIILVHFFATYHGRSDTVRFVLERRSGGTGRARTRAAAHAARSGLTASSATLTRAEIVRLLRECFPNKTARQSLQNTFPR